MISHSLKRFIMIALHAAIILPSVVRVAIADSSSPRLAAYYDRKMLLCGERAYQWQGGETPKPVADNVAQVGVGLTSSYILTDTGQLMAWDKSPEAKRQIFDQVKWFAAGRSGVLAIRTDHTLWHLERADRWFGEGEIAKTNKIAEDIVAASIGDSANYYVTRAGTLYVKGLARRGQYGDGKLQASENFIPVASNVVSVNAHTGHAILLTKDGTVMGTGGNIYGPLGRHGIGDKAIIWGPIFKNALSVATGSSHSLAIRADGSLWIWGRDIGLDPRKIMENVQAVAADSSGSIALQGEKTLWQWDRDQQPRRHFRCP